MYISLISVFQFAEREFQSDSSARKSNITQNNKTENLPVNKTAQFYITFLTTV